MPPAPIDPHDPDTLRGLRELAERAARAGGAVARAAFGRVHAVRRKADGSEVTDADEAAQAAVIDCLQAARAGDAIIAEEALAAGVTPRNDMLCWVVDPLDGTRNYVRGVPLYTVSVAAMFGGYPIAGAVYEPGRDEMYSAGGAEGMLLNGRRASPAAQEGLGKPLAGIPSSVSGEAWTVLEHWFTRVVLRNLGSTALHLALVAGGQFRAVLITDGRLWDIAAGWLLVHSTGGVTTTLSGVDLFPLDVARYAGEPLPCIAACDPEVYAQLQPPVARRS